MSARLRAQDRPAHDTPPSARPRQGGEHTRELPLRGRPPRDYLILLLIIAAGTALRFTALGQQSFWYDEAHSIEMARGLPGGGPFTTITNTHGPFYLVLLRGWMALFGSSEAAVRALSAVLGSVGVFLIYKVAVGLLGRSTALVAAALLAISPFHLWYSQEGRNYALLFDLGLLAVPAFLAEIAKRTKGSFAAAVLATAGVCLANLSGFFLFAFYWIYGLAGPRGARYPARRLLLLTAVSALVLWPWISGGARSTGELHLGRPGENAAAAAVKGESPPGLLSIPYTLYNFSLGMTLGPSVDELKLQRFSSVVPHLWYLIPAAALFALLLLRGLRRAPRTRLRLLILWWAIPVLLMAAVSALNLKAPNSRYAFLGMAPYVLLLSAGISSLTCRPLKIFAIVAVAGLMAISDYQYFKDQRYWRPDARSAAELLLRDAKPGDAVIVYALDYPVGFYLRGRIDYAKPPGRIFRNNDSMKHWLTKNTAGAGRVWIVQCQGWWVDREDRFVRLAGELMEPRGTWRFTKAPVYLFEKRPAGSGAAAAPRTG